MKVLFFRFLAVLFIISPVMGFAHEGHGPVKDGVGHYILSPEHAIPLTLLVFAGVYFLVRKKIKKTA